MDLPWIQSPAIQQLLHRLVDRLDATEARGNASTLALPLNAKNWPELYQATYESDKEALWEQVLQLHKAAWIQISPALAIKNSQGYDANPKIKCINVDAIRMVTSRLSRPKTAIERWRMAINEHLDASDEAKLAAGNYCIDLAGHTMVEVVQRLNRLKDLQAEPLMLREVSAKLFWGMSKVLDNRAGLVNAILGTKECPFPEAPIQLQVFLPKGGFDAVLFIENQVSYERAIRSKSEIFEKFAIVYASGFKGSARRLRNIETTSIYISSLGETDQNSIKYFENWLLDKNSRIAAEFWGDLDWSGIGILDALRQSIPNITAWRPGYEKMLVKLRSGEGHTSESTEKGGQKIIPRTGCYFTDTELIPSLKIINKFCDQEEIIFQ